MGESVLLDIEEDKTPVHLLVQALCLQYIPSPGSAMLRYYFNKKYDNEITFVDKNISYFTIEYCNDTLCKAASHSFRNKFWNP